MKKTIVLATVLTFLTTSCVIGGGPYVMDGLILSDLKGPLTATQNSGASKTGTACVMNVLGLFSYGDNSIDSAMKDGRMKTVSRVDFERFSFLGLFAKVCTIAKGE